MVRGQGPRRPGTRPDATGRRAPRERPIRIAVTAHEETAAERWLRTLRLSGFSVILLGLLILAVIVLAPGLRTLVEQQQQIAALEHTAQEGRDTVTHLEAELDRWSDPAYIETQARDRLLFIYPGESSFLLTNWQAPEGDGDDLAPTTQIRATQIDWLGGLLAATFEAGLTDATAEELPLVPAGVFR